MRFVLKNFRIVDEGGDFLGHVIVDDGKITEVSNEPWDDKNKAALVLDGSRLLSEGEWPPVIMPAFVDLHAHFRDSGSADKELPQPSEVLESASLSAAAGGFGTVVCMANTKPAIDTPEKARALKIRSDALGLVDLYPVISLTRGMEGKELSAITKIKRAGQAEGHGVFIPLMLSEDGKDLASDELFLSAMKEARRIGIPVSCHCDFGGSEAELSKKAGEKRGIWSRIEENNATRRAIELGKKAGCHIHIAHVSTKEAVEIIREAKTENAAKQGTGAFALTCEAMPHNLCLTEEDAEKLGEESFGRVNPPLRREEDRAALIRALTDGTIDAIATDHAPHSRQDKENGAPGFSGFETAFAAVYTELVSSAVSNPENKISLGRLSSLMSANPSRIIGLGAGVKGASDISPRGRILAGYSADLVIAALKSPWIVNPEAFKTRGKNSPFSGRGLYGRIIMTIHRGRVVFDGSGGKL